MREELFAVAPDGSIRGTQRNFFGICPTHGKVLVVFKIGHHSTLGEKEMNRRYPKQVRRRIRARLAKDDRPAFKLSMEGKRRPGIDEIKLWDRLAIKPIPSYHSSWLGSASIPIE